MNNSLMNHFLKIGVIAAHFFISPAFGGSEEAPNSDYLTNQTKITWEKIKHIPQTCKGIEVEHLSGGYLIQKDACIFWDKDKLGGYTCLILSKENISDNSFSRAIKYCFSGGPR